MAKLAIVFAFVVALSIALAVPISQEKDAIPEERIVGGYPAGDGMYPYQASIRNKSNKHICGASIINKNYVLTAAHCTQGEKAKNLKVVVGTNYLSTGGTSYKVSKIVQHPAYNQQTKLNDICLLKTSKTIKFTNKVQAVGLSSAAVNPGIYCILTGWGANLPPYQNLTNALQQISLKSITVQQCQNYLPSYPINYNHMCTLNGFGQGACNGDSGSPLVCGGLQYGLLSWGIPCAQGSPDVYTSISAYRAWINSVAKV